MVLFGAHSVFYNTGGYTAFDNTIGTGLIVQKARELNIPYYVIASSAKLAKEDASIKEKICNKKDHFQKRKKQANLPYHQQKTRIQKTSSHV